MYFLISNIDKGCFSIGIGIWLVLAFNDDNGWVKTFHLWNWDKVDEVR